MTERTGKSQDQGLGSTPLRPNPLSAGAGLRSPQGTPPPAPISSASLNGPAGAWEEDCLFVTSLWLSPGDSHYSGWVGCQGDLHRGPASDPAVCTSVALDKPLGCSGTFCFPAAGRRGGAGLWQALGVLGAEP